MNRKHYEITLCIEKERIESFIMDIRDASPDITPKKDDWHMLIADSMEDQAKRQEEECGCNDCKCGKAEETKPIEVIPEPKQETKTESIKRQNEELFSYRYSLVATSK